MSRTVFWLVVSSFPLINQTKIRLGRTLAFSPFQLPANGFQSRFDVNRASAVHWAVDQRIQIGLPRPASIDIGRVFPVRGGSGRRPRELPGGDGSSDRGSILRFGTDWGSFAEIPRQRIHFSADSACSDSLSDGFGFALGVRPDRAQFASARRLRRRAAIVASRGPLAGFADF